MFRSEVARAANGKVSAWREAYDKHRHKASGVQQSLQARRL
jgi:hypothetical protein